MAQVDTIYDTPTGDKMTKRKKRFLNSYAVANALAFNVPPTPPARNAPKEVRDSARRGLMTFYTSVSRGTAPAPDAKRGTTNLWDEEKFERYLEEKERERRKKKKADDCANNHQPEPSSPDQRKAGGMSLHHPRQNVNGEDNAVRHDG